MKRTVISQWNKKKFIDNKWRKMEMVTYTWDRGDGKLRSETKHEVVKEESDE